MTVEKHEDGSVSIKLDKYEVIDTYCCVLPCAESKLKEIYKDEVQDYYHNGKVLHGYIERDKSLIRKVQLLDKLLREED